MHSSTLRSSRASWVGLGLAVSLALVAFTFSTTLAHAATLSTDKADYAPGETATIYGSLFDALQTVALTIVGQAEDGSTAVSYSWGVPADEAGSFTTFYQLPDFYVPLYLLAANSDTGEVLAETTFTDANLNVTINGTGSTGSGTVSSSGSNCTITLGVASGDCADSAGGSPASITFTAAQAVGSTFDHWAGNCSGTSLTCTLFSNPTGTVSKTATAVFTLNPVVVSDQTISFGALANKTYGDADFDVSATASSGLTVTFTASGDCSMADADTVHITGAGSCTVTAHQAGNASYNPAPDVPQSFDIAKAPAGCSISGYTGTYNGAPHGATGSCTGTGVLALGATFINVPGGTANWTFTGDVNHEDASGSVAIVINKAPAGCSISGYSGTYDGASHGATGSCAGTGTLDLGASFTNVPGGTADWTFTGDTNHEDDADSVAIDISKAPSTVIVDCSVGAPFTYTGLAQTPCTAEATGVGMSAVNVTGSIVYGNNVHAGAATADASWGGDANHDGDTGSGGFTIGQAVLTVTSSGASVLQGAPMPTFTPGYSGFVNSETANVLNTAPTCSASVGDTNTPGDHPTNCSGGADGDYSFNYVAGALHVYSLASVFKGLFNPLKITIKDFQKNSTIPVKFALSPIGGPNFYGGQATLQVCDEDSVPANTCFDAVSSGVSNTLNIFRYDAGAGQYIFNLSTKMPQFVKGHTYDFKVTINGITQTAVQKAMIKL